MNKDEIKRLRDFDVIVAQAGGHYIDTTMQIPPYRIRDLCKWAKKHGKNVEDLTEKEREQFLIKENKFPKKIWLIRHGESTANAGAATSNHKTIPLSLTGQEQAQTISRSIPETPTLIITSAFDRTRQTAEPTIKLFPSTRSEIWEVEEFTYLSPNTCINTTAADRKIRVNEYWERLDPAYIDGEGAESFNMLLARAKAVIDRLRGFESGLIVIFTHALFMQAIEALRVSDGKEDAKSLMARFRGLPRFDNCQILKWGENNNPCETCAEREEICVGIFDSCKKSPPSVIGQTNKHILTEKR